RFITASRTRPSRKAATLAPNSRGLISNEYRHTSTAHPEQALPLEDARGALPERGLFAQVVAADHRPQAYRYPLLDLDLVRLLVGRHLRDPYPSRTAHPARRPLRVRHLQQ